MKQRDYSVDSMKAILALLVVCLHVPFLGQTYVIPIARSAVPMFFMISGYLLAFREKDFGKIASKIVSYFILSSLFYLAIRDSLPATPFMTPLRLQTLKTLILYNVTPYAQHLWYLLAYIYVLLVVSVVKKNFRKIAWYSIPVLLIVHYLLGEFCVDLYGYPQRIMYVRNFLLLGIPCFFLGDWLAIMRWKIQRKSYIWLLLSIIFSLISILEYKIYDEARKTDLLVSTVPLSITLFLYFTSLTHPNRALSYIGRHFSTLIYILHPAVYYFLLLWFPAPSIILVVTTTLSICWLSEKIKAQWMNGGVKYPFSICENNLNIFSDYRQELMGIAILLVMLSHTCRYQYIHIPGLSFIARNGYLGVDAFIFLSGMGLCFSRWSSYTKFMKKRFIRIFPTFWVSLFVYLAIDVITGMPMSIYDYLIKATTLGFWVGKHYDLWYISAIVVFYLLYLIIRNYASIKNVPWVVAMAIALCLCNFVLENVCCMETQRFLFFSRIPIFFIGICVGKLLLLNKKSFGFHMSQLLLIAVVCLCFYLYLGKNNWRLYMRAGIMFILSAGFIPQMLYLICCVLKMATGRVRKPLAFVGGISLELYCVHVVIFKYIYNSWILMLLAFPLSVFLAWMLSLVVNKSIRPLIQST